ncbi:hypothetical protein [Jiangella asiatica]|uniref:Uncharacterized protein n=1 Tax=Jiangella asiatica TaxID=2530372 RepID=A0A4R5D5I3_9ACTN|nr:hypothetical protein [Jiangella asiatica]TDE08729.1 hypothetical protein E1269_16275 [Jiangella asiatica]
MINAVVSRILGFAVPFVQPPPDATLWGSYQRDGESVGTGSDARCLVIINERRHHEDGVCSTMLATLVERENAS